MLSPSIRRKKKKAGRPRMDDKKEGYERYFLRPYKECAGMKCPNCKKKMDIC